MTKIKNIAMGLVLTGACLGLINCGGSGHNGGESTAPPPATKKPVSDFTTPPPAAKKPTSDFTNLAIDPREELCSNENPKMSGAFTEYADPGAIITKCETEFGLDFEDKAAG